MSIHVIAGAPDQSLLDSLAALGLVRTIAEQRDPSLTCHYTSRGLEIDCDVDDIASWLTDDYRPTPVLSPWNEGSGFGAKDVAPKAALNRLLGIGGARLDAYRAAAAMVTPLAAAYRDERWSKRELVRRIRNACPDVMLPWLDSAVVVVGDDLAFPPLLGTGGNDGRLEFSTGFHQRLLDVLPVDEAARSRSIALARDWLSGTSEQPLVVGVPGQFDPGGTGTPNSSPFGAGDSIVNPWAFVLMVEGTMMFTAAPARRLSSQASSTTRAAMTFMTFGSDVGSVTGTTDEGSRGELWVPRWVCSLSFNDVRALFEEGRGVWRGRTAVQSGQMYLAAASGGVSSRIEDFDRYSFAQRNGLAFSAVRVDSVKARNDEALLLVAKVEDWPDRADSRGSPATIRRAVDRFRHARVRLAQGRDDAAVAVRELLCAVTLLELAVSRSTHLREDIPPRQATDHKQFTRLFELEESKYSGLLDCAEFRVALGLASISTGALPGAPQGRSIRELLIAVEPAARGTSRSQWRETAVVAGLDLLQLDHLLADVALRLAISAQGEASGAAEVAPSERSTGIRGFRGSRVGVQVPDGDLHTWVRGELDTAEIFQWFLALLVFDWRGTKLVMVNEGQSLIDPVFALLAPFRNGLRPRGDIDGPAYGLSSEWIHQLIAGRIDTVRGSVSQRLRQLGWSATTPYPTGDDDSAYGRRLVAALLPSAISPRAAMARVTRPLHDADNDAATATDSRPAGRTTPDSLEETP